MKKISPAILAASFLAAFGAFAQSPVTVAIDTTNTTSVRHQIPADFVGVSIFSGTQAHDHRGIPGNLFSGTNTQLITLFKNAGIRHLRLGATGSSKAGTENLPHEDIDALFAFAKAVDMRVIFSLHAAGAPETAKYVADHYAANLECFAFDNEPDKRTEKEPDEGAHFSEFIADWKKVTDAVRAAVPDAKFAGPDSAGRSLTGIFVDAEIGTGKLVLVTQHFYVGGNSVKQHLDLQHGTDNMLSRDWVTNRYPALYRAVFKPIEAEGLPVRMTELNDYVHGVTNASDAFAGALWALDAMHWWAAKGAAGVNFQNTEWIPTDTFYIDAATNYQMHPKVYAMRAFTEGGHGATEPLKLENPDGLNLTAYAVADGTNHFVTLINKEHGTNARAAQVILRVVGATDSLKDGIANAAAMYLTSANGDLSAKTGITFGGEVITNNAEWHGRWTVLGGTKNWGTTVTVPPASAVVVRAIFKKEMAR